MSIPFYIPDVSSERELILGGPTGAAARSTYTHARGDGVPPTPQRTWVAVDPLTKTVVDTDIKQPDPGRLVLCANISKFGRTSYGYYDEIPRWYRRLRILSVVFAILTTPLVLFCCLPALKYMKKVILRY